MRRIALLLVLGMVGFLPSAAVSAADSASSVSSSASDSSSLVAPSGTHDPGANAAAAFELPTIAVISTTPVPGLGMPLSKIPGNVQSIEAQRADSPFFADFEDMLNQNLGSVFLSDTQGSPVQMDVNFRGFTASPVLGTPQGLSVFLDGVRVNEAFGDTVNWDLIPQNAISSINLMPGSNPVFGLNTLGGALSIQTKSGFEFPGTRLSVSDGSFARRNVRVETGGHGDNLDYFVAGNFLEDNGWACCNPTQVRQIFAKTGYQDDLTDLDLTLISADNQFMGNQTIPLSFMGNLTQPYTWPDINTDRLTSLSLHGSHFLDSTLLIAGNLYFRNVTTGVFNSNAGACNNSVNPAGAVISSADSIPIAQASLNDQGCNISSIVQQSRIGTGVQITSTRPWAELENSFTAGFSYDHGLSQFSESNQPLAVMPGNRNTATTAPVTGVVNLDGTTISQGIYLTDTLSLSPKTHLTLSGRYDHAAILLADQLGGDLNGSHTYHRIDPAAGLTFNPHPNLTTYLNFSQGMRVPTPTELGCANPAAPCALPNAFASDPNLQAVVSTTWELGARGGASQGLSWNAALFDTVLHNDIEYLASPNSPTQGYFSNVGSTLRRGLELGAAEHSGAWHLSANYTFLQATYQSSFSLNGVNSSANALGIYNVTPGERIPGIPQQILKLRLDYTPMPSLILGTTLLAQTSNYPRGDENNLDSYGAIPGFAVLNLDVRYRWGEHWELFARVDNAFNRTYATYGQLASNSFAGGNYTPNGVAMPFETMASPLGMWLGAAWHFGTRPADPT